MWPPRLRERCRGRRAVVLWSTVVLCAASAFAQGRPQRTAPPADAALLTPIRFRSIGPAGPGGRIADIAVSTIDPNVIFLAYATGGLFKSTNGGTVFKPVFESYGTASFGTVAFDPTNPNVVYAGTGEDNNRQTSSFGDGLYKTVDGGKVWTNIGLRNTQTISRIVIDPRDPQIVYVAVDGHLFGPNPERGVYETTDGGKNWDRILYVNENTGFTDIAIDPSDPARLYAASYQRRRSGCCFNGGGPGSGLWKTTDAGRHWTRLRGRGLPTGVYGRIAIAVAHSDPRVVYAQVQVGKVGAPGGTLFGRQNASPVAPRRSYYNWCDNGAQEVRPARVGIGKIRVLDPTRGGVYRSMDRGRTWVLMSNCDPRPSYFSRIVVDPENANTVYVAGPEASESTDGGKTFRDLSQAGGNGEPGHVDIHAIWVDPGNSKHLMLGSDGGLNVTRDGGKNWRYVTTMSVGQAYWVSADMRRPYHVVIGMQDNGAWGGPSSMPRSTDGAILNSAWYGISPCDGFYTAVDETDYNIVYTESMDGMASRYDLRAGSRTNIQPTSTGAPGDDPSCVRGYEQYDQLIGRRMSGRARHGNVLNAVQGEQYRFNWDTPFEISPTDPNILWLGGNRLFKSYNRGDTWIESADLTKQIDRDRVRLMSVLGSQSQLSKNDGVASYGTIIAISASPVAPEVVWAGTDDGNLKVSRDGGLTFTEVGPNIPGLPAGALSGKNPYWISSIEGSHFDGPTAYVAVDGHRSDDLRPYVFVTHDFGRTFQSATGDLPSYGDVRVIRQDPKNSNLLYVGTEFGLFVSLNSGKTWTKMTIPANNFPTVRTDDILIHPRDGDLIVATHGRGVWIADDVTPLQQFTPEMREQDALLFDPRPAVAYRHDIESDRCRPTLPCLAQSVFAGENAPKGTAINYYLRAPIAGGIMVSVTDIEGRVLCTSKGSDNAGINRVQWTLATQLAAAPPLAAPGGDDAGAQTRALTTVSCSQTDASARAAPGEYTVRLSVGGHTYTKIVRVFRDRWLDER